MKILLMRTDVVPLQPGQTDRQLKRTTPTICCIYGQLASPKRVED
jgi:hypothetical protein